LDLVCLVKVVLQDLFRLLPRSIQQDIVKVGDIDVVFHEVPVYLLEVFIDKKHLGIEEPIDYGDLTDLDYLVVFLGVVVLTIAQEKGDCVIVLVFETALDCLEIV